MARILSIGALALIFLIPLTLHSGDLALGEKLYKWKDEHGVWHITNDPNSVPKDVEPSRVQTEGKRSTRQRVRAYYAQARESPKVQAALGMAGVIMLIVIAAYAVKRYRKKRLRNSIQREIKEYERRSREPINL